MGGLKYDGRIERYRKILYDVLAKERTLIGTVKRKDIPKLPGIYLVFELDNPVYVGSTKDLKRRIASNLKRGRGHYLSSLLRKRMFSGDRDQTVAYLAKCSIVWCKISPELRAEWVERFCQSILKTKYNQAKALPVRLTPVV
jgi:hypothetical protein